MFDYRYIMDPAAQLQQILTHEPGELTERELFDLDARIDELLQVINAAAMLPRAEAARRKAHRAGKHRSHPTALAAETRLARSLCARRINHASILVDHLPDLYQAYATGRMNQSQIDLVLQFHNESILRPFVERDQSFFLKHAKECWPIFRMMAYGWAATTREREEPDFDKDEKAHNNRKLIWGQGLDNEVLGEFHMPNALFEQFQRIVTPFYDELLRVEIREAKLAAGVDAELEQDESEFLDLTRSNSQRWLDAMMIALRVRGSEMRAVREDAVANGLDSDTDLQIDLDEFDAGVAAQVIIVVDQETLEREIARQHGHGGSLEPRSHDSIANARCETLSGLPVSPSTALFYAEVGSFRRMLVKPDNLDFDISKKARLFTGPKRIGLMVRDRFCQGPGCETAAKYCQGDHVLEYTRGGLTVPTNGKLLCGPCNRHKEKLRLHALH